MSAISIKYDTEKEYICYEILNDDIRMLMEHAGDGSINNFDSVNVGKVTTTLGFSFSVFKDTVGLVPEGKATDLFKFLKRANYVLIGFDLGTSSIDAIRGEITAEEFVGKLVFYGGTYAISGVALPMVLTGLPLLVATTSVAFWATYKGVTDEDFTKEIGNAIFDIDQVLTNAGIEQFNQLSIKNPNTDSLLKLYTDMRGTPLSIYVDPLVLDLDGDGNINPASTTYFDFDGDGVRELGYWFAPTDGMLALDRDGDGTINSGRELFGDATILANGTKSANGFSALSDIDSNKDGKIDIYDAEFANLRVWKDINGDGISQSDELFSLESLGIESINTTGTVINRGDELGNTQIHTGSFTYADGTTGTMGDWLVEQNRMATQHNLPELTAEQKDLIKGLPELESVGNLLPLSYVMATNDGTTYDATLAA